MKEGLKRGTLKGVHGEEMFLKEDNDARGSSDHVR